MAIAKQICHSSDRALAHFDLKATGLWGDQPRQRSRDLSGQGYGRHHKTLEMPGGGLVFQLGHFAVEVNQGFG